MGGRSDGEGVVFRRVVKIGGAMFAVFAKDGRLEPSQKLRCGWWHSMKKRSRQEESNSVERHLAPDQFI